MILADRLRPVGISLWLIVGIASGLTTEWAMDTRSVVWITGFAIFGVAYLASMRWHRPALAVQLLALGAMQLVLPCHFGALLTAVIAWQLAAVLRPRWAIVGIALQTTLLAVCIARLWSDRTTMVAEVLTIVGLQTAAAAAIHIGRREREARMALTQVNGELLATRALLELSSRRNERIRISRELHDVLGHDLTALRLQLEVASNVPSEAARGHVDRASEIARRLLRDVRDVVGQLRTRDHDDLESVIRMLVADLPGLRVHLEFDADEVAPVHAHCLIRCVQEVVTNAVKHSGAHNLWLQIAVVEHELTIDARDDGHGAPEVTWGQGLSGMRARVEELGGMFGITTAPGFAVRACLPRERAA
jgi:signal transduction histidine kinase